MSLLETLYENRKRLEEDKQYFSLAFSPQGRRYSEQYSTKPQLLGRGGFGFVRSSKVKGECVNQTPLATKVVDCSLLQPWQLEDGQLLEARILQALHHPNIVPVLEVFHNPGYFLLVMHQGPGSLLWTLVDLNKHLKEHIARDIFIQVVEAVSYLHQQGITHNDIKDENIMVAREELKVTIIDFGSAVREDGQLTRTYCGSETYTSPEVLAGKRFYRLPQEVWSLGVLLWVMVYGANPFDNVVAAEECILKFPQEGIISEACLSLLSSILTKTVSSRPSMASISSHPWLTEQAAGQKEKWNMVWQ